MPGHERFVRTMISGATGIDAVLLVVGANEGIQPQTVEHVEIAGLIGVRRGIVAVTKCDLAPAEDALAAGEAAIRLARAAGIADVTVVRTSAVTGEGLEDLRERLGRLAADAGGRTDAGVFWLPTDRVFAVPGFGTVVTGTLRRGILRVGDEVELMPGGRRARVRSLQIHGRPVEAAPPGRRTAVNLRGVEQSDLTARDGAGVSRPADRLAMAGCGTDAAGVGSTGASGGAVVRLLTGTVETAARLRLLDRDRLEPGASAMVQLFTETPVAVPAGEPFIIRTPSPPATIGGGRILDPVSRRRRRHDANDTGAAARAGESRSGGDPGLSAPRRREPRDAAWPNWRGCWRYRRNGCACIWRMRGRTCCRTAPCSTARPDAIWKCEVLALVEEHHRDHPTEPGLPRDRLGRNASAVATPLIERGELRNEQGRLRHRDFDPAALLSDRDRRLIAAVEREFLTGGLAPPDASAVVGNDRGRFQAIRYLTRTGVLVRTADRVQKREILFHRDALAKAQRIMTIHLADRTGGFLVADLGRLLGISRKYSIPLLEHLDAIRFTRRLDDRRVIAESTTGKTLSSAWCLQIPSPGPSISSRGCFRAVVASAKATSSATASSMPSAAVSITSSAASGAS